MRRTSNAIEFVAKVQSENDQNRCYQRRSKKRSSVDPHETKSRTNTWKHTEGRRVLPRSVRWSRWRRLCGHKAKKAKARTTVSDQNKAIITLVSQLKCHPDFFPFNSTPSNKKWNRNGIGVFSNLAMCLFLQPAKIFSRCKSFFSHEPTLVQQQFSVKKLWPYVPSFLSSSKVD